MILSIDIETVPQPRIMDTWYPEWAAGKHPDKTPAELEDMAALYPEFGMVCAVSVVKFCSQDELEVAAEYTATTPREEGLILGELAQRFSNRYNIILVGHNIKGFDIPFLAKRFMAHEIAVPEPFQVLGKKPWEIQHRDTMELMKFGGGATMSLRAACHLLGIRDPKGECIGSMVPQLLREGRVEEVKKYCTGDAMAAAMVYQALIKFTGLLV